MLNQSPALDRMFHSLADPARRRIVEQLARGPASVSALADPLEMSLPGVMQHIGVLEEAGLVRSEKVGRVRTCRLESAALQSAEDWIARRRAECERRLDRLEDLLRAQDLEIERQASRNSNRIEPAGKSKSPGKGRSKRS